MRHGFSVVMMPIEKCNTSQGNKTKTVFITALCVTVLAETFCILRGALTKIRMSVQLDDTSIGF